MRTAQVEPDRGVVDDLDLVRGIAKAGDDVDRRAAKLNPARVGVLHGLGVCRGAILERYVGEEFEGVGRLIVADFPRFSQHRLEFVGTVTFEDEQHLVDGERDR